MAMLETLASDFKRARPTDCTNTAFSAARVQPVAADPRATQVDSASAAYFLDMVRDGNSSQNALHIVPYGVGSDGTTFSMRVFLWKRHNHAEAGLYVPQWLPVFAGEFLCTLDSSVTGAAGAKIDATHYFCKTVALTYPTTQPSSIEIISPVAGLIGSVMLDMKGPLRLQVEFSTGSSATSCNALLGFL